jgi:phage tail-like protein
MERLTVSRDEKVVQSVDLSDAVLTIGRTPDNTLILEDTQVSRRHAELRRDAQGILLTDVGSTNGTFVDGTRLLPQQPFLLNEGQAGTIGPFHLFWRTVSSEESATLIEPPDPENPLRERPDLPAEAMEPGPEFRSGVQVTTAELPQDTPQRPRFPTPFPTGPRCQYLQDLPMMFEEDDFFNRFLLIFETLWEPLERRQDHIAMYFDPRTCPAVMLPWLATWLNLELNPHWPETRIRRILSEAMELYRWRGTRYGLTRLLEICTDITPTITEFPDQPHLIAIYMPLTSIDAAQRELVERLIQIHKPAHIGYTLRFSPEE